MTTIRDPSKAGNPYLPHRLAMAPMARGRAKPDGTPSDLAAEYYAQRVSMGLLITEGPQPSDDGQGYLATLGIYTDAHVDGWWRVTQAGFRRAAYLRVTGNYSVHTSAKALAKGEQRIREIREELVRAGL